MALIKCSECGREVSAKAASCPACGNPIAAQSASSAGRQVPPTKLRPKHTAAEWAISWGLSALIVVLAFMLNPSEADHRAKLRAAIETRHPITQLFGISQLGTLDVKYENFGFMSLTTRASRNVTLGMYGYVYVFNPRAALRERAASTAAQTEPLRGLTSSKRTAFSPAAEPEHLAQIKHTCPPGSVLQSPASRSGFPASPRG